MLELLLNRSVPIQKFSIEPNKNLVNEGETVVFTIITENVPDGTELYWTIHGTVIGNDFVVPATSGKVTIQNNQATLTFTLKEDELTETQESFFIRLRKDSIAGEILANSSTVLVNDTSKTRTYSITPNVSSINEGGSVNFLLTTTNVPNGTTLRWEIQGTNGTVNAADFTDGLMAANFVVNNNTATITRTLSEDNTTEGVERFRMNILPVDRSRTLVQSSVVTINDTSLSYGEVIFDTPGEHEFIIPAGVTQISAVIVGRGGDATQSATSPQRGGGGGGLSYRNNVTVTVGRRYRVIISDLNNGRCAILNDGNNTVIEAYNANYALGGRLPNLTSFVKFAGGNSPNEGSNQFTYNGSGGAAGYAGNGGDGGYGPNITASQTGSYYSEATSPGKSAVANSGGGGGGSGVSGNATIARICGYPGGGVGLKGIGTTGSGGTVVPGTGGSGGGSGNSSTGNGGSYGGGAGIGTLANGIPGSSKGIPGRAGIRIIWGGGRTFPSNAA